MVIRPFVIWSYQLRERKCCTCVLPLQYILLLVAKPLHRKRCQFFSGKDNMSKWDTVDSVKCLWDTAVQQNSKQNQKQLQTAPGVKLKRTGRHKIAAITLLMPTRAPRPASSPMLKPFCRIFPDDTQVLLYLMFHWSCRDILFVSFARKIWAMCNESRRNPPTHDDSVWSTLGSSRPQNVYKELEQKSGSWIRLNYSVGVVFPWHISYSFQAFRPTASIIGPVITVPGVVFNTGRWVQYSRSSENEAWGNPKCLY